MAAEAVSSLSAVTLLPATTTSSGLGTSAASQLRTTDFMSIMLAEITNQDPTNPEDTSTMVTEMQEIQSLANSQFQALQNNLKWSQTMIGQQVTVGQMQATTTQQQALEQAGITPGVGSDTRRRCRHRYGWSCCLHA